jgi:ABC-2 type transport system permease protein
LLRNSLASLVATSRLRLGMILFCSVVFWVGLFALFFEGFRFLNQYFPLTNDIVIFVFSMFFLSLLIMLVFSTGIILYTSLFQSREAAYLLTTPAPPDRIFAHKFLEAMAFSSWGFLLLGSPMMAAYGLTAGAPWPFYALFLAYLVGFVVIPGAAGGVGAILVAMFLPRRQKTVIGLMIAAAIAAGVVLAFRVARTPGDAMTRDWMDSLLGRLEFSQAPLLPSLWMSKGLIGAARGDWGEGLFYLAETAAHGALAYLVAAVLARDLYRPAYSRVQGGRSSRRRFGWYALDAAFHRVFAFIPRPVRLLILKDVRTFRRDPAQWSQFLIFFGLLAFYFLNIRRLGYSVDEPYWRNLLSLLNLAVTALILSTFTSRFIFPLLSLEGRNFWVLGLLPLRREAILWGKFAFASGISLVATEGLVVLSDLMLRMGTAMIALHMGTVAILCLGLSAISVGLGARLPNLKEEDPSKIASGFGGTLNLLVSLAFIATILVALAVPSHLYVAGRGVNDFGPIEFADPRFRHHIALAVLACLAAGAVATIVPLRIGIKAFQRMEF